jgi:ferritin
MKMNSELKKALNKQITMEMYSSYIYLSMAADFFAKNLGGFGQWMRVQSGEETGHGMKIFTYLLERGETVELEAIDAPPKSWATPLDAFKTAYAHEQKVTAAMAALTELARDKKDHATEIFLQWFVSEQVEEEAHADEIVKKLEMVKDNTGALLMLNHELGQRAKA